VCDLDIDVQTIAAESLGTRSMATKVTTPDVGIMIDAGTALGPRFGLLPHPLEYRALVESRERIRKASETAEVSVVTHYHQDHYSPPLGSDYLWTWSDKKTAAELYIDKIVLAKDPRENINPSQRFRAYHFNAFLEGLSREVRVADGASFEFGETRVEFSRPVPHGEEGTRLGYVIMLKVEWRRSSFVFASDVQGPMSDATREAILRWGASSSYVGGPPAYLAPFQVGQATIDQAIGNMAHIASKTPLLIVDHHLMRSANWKELLLGVEGVAKKSGHTLATAASVCGAKENVLEARRDQLYRDLPPSREFLAWTKKEYEKRRITPPPF
jgi:predicted metallo-beta-lactamase superfamily hydrolase